MKDKKIEEVKNWAKPKSIRDIQVFLGFTNFNQRFIQGLDKIAKPFILMFQTTESSKILPSLMNMDKRNDVGTVGDSNNCKDKTVKRSLSKNLNGAMGYLIHKARLAFTKLRKTFTKALIL